VSGDTPVLILTGPPGVGKTTAAASLAVRSPRAVHLEADHFFRFIRSGFVEPWSPESNEQNAAVMRIVAAAATGYASAGYFTVVDGILIPGWFLEPVRDALREAGHRVAVAILRAPLSVCLSRLREREGGPGPDSGAIEQLWQSFADAGELETNVLEVGEESSVAVADLLARRLEDGLLVV
jgi:predicted kinase